MGSYDVTGERQVANPSPNTAGRTPMRVPGRGARRESRSPRGGVTLFESYRERRPYREHLVSMEGVRMQTGPTATQLGTRSLASLARHAAHERGGDGRRLLLGLG